MRTPRAIAGALLVLLVLLVASGCGDGDGTGDTVAVDPDPVDLTVQREAVLPEDGARPIEGTVSTFVLRDEAGAEVEPGSQDADGAPSYVGLVPGRYTLTSEEYLCIGSCEVAGEPAATCEQELDLTADSRVTVRVRLGAGPCEIEAQP